MPVRVLLVDDQVTEPLLLEDLLLALDPAAQVTCVHSGAAALAVLDATPDLPHVMLLDLHLPGLSGLDVLRTVKASARFRALPVILRSGSTALGDEQAALAAGAAAYLRKPWRLEAQQAQLQEVLDRWRPTQ